MYLNVFGKKIHVVVKDLTDYQLDGYFDPNDYSIAIDPKADDPLQSLCHELFHSVWFRTGIIQTKIPMEVQEIIIENIATALVENIDDILKWNKAHKKNKSKKRIVP